MIRRKTLLLFLALVIVPSANAAMITINFGGALQSITTGGDPGNDALSALGFTPGDAVSGSVVYDDTAPGLISVPTQTSYSTALQSISITIGSFAASSSSGTFLVRDDHMAGSAAPLRDSIVAQGFSGFSPTGIGGLNLTRLQFALGSADLTKLASTAFPSIAEINSLSDIFQGNLNFVQFENGEALRFQLNQFTASSSVPEPGTLGLLGLGLLGLGLARRKHV